MLDKRILTVMALVTVGFPLDDEPPFNSKYDLTVATPGSYNLRCRSN